jgi:hypothetical protein
MPGEAMSDAMARAFADMFAAEGSTALIANTKTRVEVLEAGGLTLPMTVNDTRENGNCYIVSPTTAYVDYALEETQNFAGARVVKLGAGALIRMVAPLVRASRLDRQVQVNNWLFSTNPLPLLTDQSALAIRDKALKLYPHHAVVIRSLNPVSDGDSLAALKAAGFRLWPSRQVYLSVERAEGRFAAQDRQLVRKTPLHFADNHSFQGADFERAAGLYRALYLEKYTPLNPAYSALFLRKAHADGLLTLQGYRNDQGELLAFGALFAHGAVLTQPLVGYDTARPMSDGLYRLIMAQAMEFAADTGLTFNLSAGAADFKRKRGAVPVIEYTAIYNRHLPRSARLAARMVETLLARIAVPLIERFEL